MFGHKTQEVTEGERKLHNNDFFCAEVPRSRSNRRTAALRLIVQPCDKVEEKDDQFFFTFPSNGAPVE